MQMRTLESDRGHPDGSPTDEAGGRRRRLLGRVTTGAAGIVRTLMGDGLSRRGRAAAEQAGRGIRTLREDLGEVRGTIGRFGTDMRGIRHDVRRVGGSVRQAGTDLRVSLNRIAAALFATPQPAAPGDGPPKPAPEDGEEGRRPPTIPVGGSAPRPGDRPPIPTPQPESMRAARPPPAGKKRPAAKSAGKKTVPGTIGQDPRWGA
jgi:hypothetical protein